MEPGSDCLNNVNNKKRDGVEEWLALKFRAKKSNDNNYRTSKESNSSQILRQNTSRNEEKSMSSVQISVRTQDKCKLSEWGLPASIYEKYEQKGVTTMFPWQVECLASHSILEENKNLVYSAPTSAGKTLVSEILMLKSVLEQKKKAIFILPFVSVVREKMFYFQDLLSDSGIRVEGFMGNITPTSKFSSVNIAIATIEKANSLINRLIEEGELSSIGIIVIDELHLLGDPSRGYLLELLLTKLKYASLKKETVRIQLVGMSATLPNLPSLAKWLNAELYKTDFRPIPLAEHCKIGDILYDNKFNQIRTLPAISELTEDVENIFQLCLETIQDGHGTLIFCPTKNWCEKLALQIANVFAKLGYSNSTYGAILREKLDTSLIKETLEQLKRCPIGLDGVLKNTVSFGVAFHHAGLTMDERDIIEGAFRVGSLKVLTATSTLSSGVNLPARRVIIRSPIFNRQALDTLVYRQMIGRAGRMGKDTAGESILICKPSEKPAATSLLSASLDPIESCLEGSGRLLRTLLEAIASQMVRTTDDLRLYLQCTFAVACDEDNLKDCVTEATTFLMMNEFITTRKLDEAEDAPTYLEATPLGKACLAAAISPRDGLYLFEELQKARRCIALDSELHILYLVTPYDAGSQIGQIDWMNYMDIWRMLQDCERRIGALVGVEERFLILAMQGKALTGKKLNIHRRFYTALALYDLIHEVPLNVVCKKYNCCRGLLQSLQQSSATLAGMVTQFCKELGWSCMELLVSQFQARLQFGVGRDLLDLLRLTSLNGIRARSLYKEGIKNVADLASANERDVERALNKAIPFESAKDNVDDDQYNEDIAEKRKMKTIFITGRDGLTAQQAAVILIQEARELIQNELGVKTVKWQNQDEETSIHETSQSTIIDSKNLKNQSSTVMSESIETSVIAKNHSIIASNQNLISNMQISKNRLSVASLPDQDMFASPKSQSRLEPEKSVKVMENNRVSQVNSLQEDMFANSINVENLKPEKEQELKAEMKSEIVMESLPSEFMNTMNEPKIGSVLRNQNNLELEQEQDMFSNTVQTNKPNVEEPKSLPNTESHVGIEILSSDFMNTFNDPNKLSKSTKTGELDTVDRIMEELPTIMNTINTQKSSQLKQETQKEEDNEIISFGTPWYDKNIPQKSQPDVEVDQFKPPPSPKNVFPTPKDRSVKEKSRRSSTFNDSFMDVAMCEILEQNVFEFDVDKSSTSPSIDKKGQNNVESEKTKLGKDLSKPSTTWIDVSWSQLESKNIKQVTSEMKSSNKLKSSQVTISVDEDILSDKLSQTKLTNKTNSTVKNELKGNKINDEIGEKENKNKDLKRRFSSLMNSNEENTMNLMSWHDTCEVSLKKPRVSLHDQENLCNSTNSDSSKSSKNSRREKSKTPTELEAKAKSRSPLETVKNNDDIISSSERTKTGILMLRKSALTNIDANVIAKFTEDDIKEDIKYLRSQNYVRDARLKMKNKVCPELPAVKKSKLSRKETNTDDLNTEDLIEDIKYLRSQNYTKELQLKITNQQSLDDFSSIDGSSIGTPRRKSIYAKTNDEITEEDLKFDSINVIRLESSKSAFKLFKAEIEQQTDVSLALACDAVAPTNNIGMKIIGQENDEKIQARRSGNFVVDNKRLCGVAVTWGLSAIYFMSLLKSPDDKVTIKDRLSILTKLLNSTTMKMHCFATKDVYKALFEYIEISPLCSFVDPKTASWLLNPDSTEKSFRTIAMEHFSKGKYILDQCDTSYGSRSPGLNTKSSFSAFNRAVGEALLTWYISESLQKKLKSKSPAFLKTFEEIEMKILPILARMELRGFGLNTVGLRELAIVMQQEMKALEEKAYTLAGRPFRFCSPKDVAEVLNLTKKGKISTGKSVLEKCDNPIASIIILWRKLNTTESKVIIPILNSVENDSRVRGNSITHTVTGRISMYEPNIQSVPKDFMSYDQSKIFSLRTAFIPAKNNVLLSADYCQLELRIMAHFSKDAVLTNAICNGTDDIFKSITAVWNRVPVDQVDDIMRNRTKQLCYGMIYGMGTKTLAETLKVTEDESTEFLENFMSTFKGVRKWLTSVIEKARAKGYVTTIMGRRRNLPGLYSNNQSEKSQAERQAVNTKVQGTAADIAKKSMILIEQRMRKAFPNADAVFPSLNDSRNLRSTANHFRGGYLVLQLHDELLFEVRGEDLKATVAIVKESMEKACKLDIPLPVKVKVGPTWGDLEEYNEI